MSIFQKQNQIAKNKNQSKKMYLFALPFKKNVLGYQVASLDMMECVKLRVIPFLISSQLQMDHIIQFSEF